ncbi:MAG: HPr family phosphocarrier protein [Gemmatimonadetes bacterium]|nr:HPr family phosphocarrier protein [Gemmatimonadota bacterium]MCB9505367.1 HPr family phosphocarrier protein [Gemmatimonadales bacterium]MCA9762378.1 HPr family phosphocarrier protein [Gemmatimonadota bacterium]MCA9768647.1 HPr family phosphocarrier protein [Gemmatimonadota bacterium]MCB9518748.1 HPr family phosphocarrier protein [Gemmatimonadales bacterium]
MVERTVTIRNELGMHARPAAQFVRLASTFGARVEIERDGMAVNGKSIMGVMMLAAECGCELTLRAEGDDAEAAVTALGELVDRGFGE